MVKERLTVAQTYQPDQMRSPRRPSAYGEGWAGAAVHLTAQLGSRRPAGQKPMRREPGPCLPPFGCNAGTVLAPETRGL